VARKSVTYGVLKPWSFRPKAWLKKVLPNKDSRPRHVASCHVVPCAAVICVFMYVRLCFVFVARCPCAVLFEGLASLGNLPPAFICHTHPPKNSATVFVAH